MITTTQMRTLLDNKGSVLDESGNKIGNVGDIYLDDDSGTPEWVTVKAGMFGGTESFVPIRDAQVAGDDIRVPYGKDLIKDAPSMKDSGEHLSPQQEDELYRYYGVAPLQGGQATGDMSTARGTTEGERGTGDMGTARGTTEGEQATGDMGTARGTTQDEREMGTGPGHDTSGPNTDSAMTRSEEKLHVGTEQATTGRARLRKYVVTEDVHTTVPVSHEEARVTREPITEANRDQAMSGAELTEEEHEVELHSERPVVEKRTEPVERVRMDTETVTDQQPVDEEVRREEIAVDEDRDTGGKGQHRPGSH